MQGFRYDSNIPDPQIRAALQLILRQSEDQIAKLEREYKAEIMRLDRLINNLEKRVEGL
jgi:hypothetical protein